MSETEICGSAQLCFPKDRSWFQGHLVTEDDSQFTVKGVRSDTNELCDVYRVSVHDHEQFFNFSLQSVMRMRKQNCRLESKQMNFESVRRYRGQRADILIQSSLPDLVGRDLDLFVGQIKIVFHQKLTPLIPYPTWSS